MVCGPAGQAHQDSCGFKVRVDRSPKGSHPGPFPNYCEAAGAMLFQIEIMKLEPRSDSLVF